MITISLDTFRIHGRMYRGFLSNIPVGEAEGSDVRRRRASYCRRPDTVRTPAILPEAVLIPSPYRQPAPATPPPITARGHRATLLFWKQRPSGRDDGGTVSGRFPLPWGPPRVAARKWDSADPFLGRPAAGRRDCSIPTGDFIFGF
jgi:hypothetical protein